MTRKSELENVTKVMASGKVSVESWARERQITPVRYVIPMLKINLISCNILDENGVTTNIAKGHSSFFDRDNHNELLGPINKRKTNGQYVAH